MGENKSKKHEIPVCKYCGREGLWFVGHTETCFKDQVFEMLKRIVELLEDERNKKD